MGRGKSLKNLALVEAARAILEEIQPASIRAVGYRLFTIKLIADMSKNETNKVSSQLTWAREQGIIPWGWIVDETREAERVNAWENPAAFVNTVKRAYRRDRWADQPEWIEVWAEKGTIRGTLAPVLHEYGVTFRVMHGYGSATAVNQVAQETVDRDRQLTVLYVGDWDPSGLHMSEEDLPNRLREYDGDVNLVRLALTEADTHSGLPSFPAVTKQGDPRYNWYVGRSIADVVLASGAEAARRHAANLQCWELDALSPVSLRNRVEQAILDRLDRDAWDRADVAEAAERESLTTILNAWPGISRPASKYEDRA